jgi:large subunit ribosomal protein L25
VKVPLAFAGEAPAVKNLGGVLVRAMHEVEVEALPQAIPHSIEISVNTLDAIGKSIYVRDIVATGSFSILANPETVIATVTEKAPEEEVVATPEAAAIEAVKVETEEKKAERDKKKEAAAEGEKGGA